MSLNRKALAAVNPLVETRDVVAIKNKTGNLYESIAVSYTHLDVYKRQPLQPGR